MSVDSCCPTCVRVQLTRGGMELPQAGWYIYNHRASSSCAEVQGGISTTTERAVHALRSRVPCIHIYPSRVVPSIPAVYSHLSQSSISTYPSRLFPPIPVVYSHLSQPCIPIYPSRAFRRSVGTAPAVFSPSRSRQPRPRSPDRESISETSSLQPSLVISRLASG
ncbi:hypothetical protein RRG08_025977 [Elysia crispata]|uniref:Uncharacterized protein n=1 Tax=Elysia crispata TaxID=231223 RepID=A0AAE1DFG7_9GAST|nr:hypothetical protein RRG08_025977 [Elysia crispata]